MTSVSGCPSPGTAFVRPCARRQRSDTDLVRDGLQRRPSIVRGHAPRRRHAAPSTAGARRDAGASQPRATSSSAISTAFVAAPLRRLSETTQNASPRPSGARGPGGPGRRRPRRAPRPRSPAGTRASRGRPGRRHRARARRAAAPARGSSARSSRRGRPPSGSEDRDAHGRARDPQVRQVQDLARLRDDLPLLLRVAVVEEDVDLGRALNAIGCG